MTAYVLLGKTGDIISCLPGIMELAKRQSRKIPLYVAKEFSEVLDGVSYVETNVFNGDWKTQVPAAKAAAIQKYGEVVVIPWWFDDVPVVGTDGSMIVSCQGRFHRIDEKRWPDITTSMYERMGFKPDEIPGLPLVFDQRSREREEKLCVLYRKQPKPLLLYNLEGKSSPFAAMPEVYRTLERFSGRFKLLDLSQIRALRIYDLLGLFDIAAGLVTVDTATLALAMGSPRLRYWAYIQDAWSGSLPRGSVVSARYFEAAEKLQELGRYIDSLSPCVPWVKSGNGKPVICLKRTLAMGDVVASTVVADKLIERGYGVKFQTNPNFLAVLERHPGISPSLETEVCDVDLNGAYEQSPLKCLHFSKAFIDRANERLAPRGIDLGPPTNCRPWLHVPEAELEPMRKQWNEFPKPWIVICPKSWYSETRRIANDVWHEVIAEIPGTKFWLGPDEGPPGARNLYVREVRPLILALAVSDLLITVDTGPMHIAAALGIPVVAIEQSSSPRFHLGDQRDWIEVSPDLKCLNCQKLHCPISAETPPCTYPDPDLIAVAALDRLRSVTTQEVSAVIPIFKPEAAMLNRCLEAVLPQVQEVIITRERGGIVPSGTIEHAKIRHVRKDEDGIGFGRNVNFGFRHTNGRFVLVLNDDVYLAPDAVSRMLEVMKPGVGVVGQLLRYPDGTIYHAGKVRAQAGGIGFPHIDYRKRDHSIRTPREMENTNGASLLFRREAFYKAGCYNEEILFYTEDDEICMELRRAGFQVWFTPLATGIHDEHAETRKMPGINTIMQQSNERFGRKWGAYFKHNAANPGLGNFDYVKV